MCVRSNFKALHYKASGYRISAIMGGRRLKSTAHAYYDTHGHGYHYKDEHERITMDKWRQRMLSSLKKGTKQKSLNVEQKKLCGRGLMVYYKLPADLKRGFIECWKSIYVQSLKWGANKCNLGWIKDFEDKYYKRSFPNCGPFTRQSCTQLHACACVCMHASHWGHASLKNWGIALASLTNWGIALCVCACVCLCAEGQRLPSWMVWSVTSSRTTRKRQLLQQMRSLQGTANSSHTLAILVMCWQPLRPTSRRSSFTSTAEVLSLHALLAHAAITCSHATFLYT